MHVFLSRGRLGPLAAMFFCLTLIGGLGPLSGAPTAQQRAEIQAIAALLTKAGNLYKDSKFAEAAEVVKEAQSRLEKLAEQADGATLAQLQAIHQRLSNAHGLFQAKGIALPELKPLPLGAPAAKGSARRGGKTAATVSFVNDVAPILNARCGNCHVRNARGMFSMATYESLMNGPPQSGKVIFPGDADGSVLIEKVQEREMPPNGAGIPESELATLKKWVEEGARFDGTDPAARLVSFLPANARSGAAPPAAIQPPSGNETISFALDIAPVLVKSCTGCHGNNNPRNDLNMTTVEGLFRGGMRGEPVLPGNPADSLLIKKLKGTAAGARMPLRADPLDGATIASFETWIAEGAKFDGPSTSQPILEVAALVKAQKSTHQELSAERATLALANWRLGMPAAAPNRYESANFLVLGSVGENSLAEIGRQAESLAPKVAEVFRAPRNQPLVKGRMTLYVFAERYDYGEFGRMVEKRDLPPPWRGHFRYSIVDAYGAVLVPKSGEYSLEALIAQQLGAVYAASLGQGVPNWFAEGCGRVVASRMAPPSDTRVAAWDGELAVALTTMAKPDDFLTGRLPPEQIDVCSFSFVKFLMSDARRFGALLDALRKGAEFSKAFADAYGGPPPQLAALWARNPPPVRRR